MRSPVGSGQVADTSGPSLQSMPKEELSHAHQPFTHVPRLEQQLGSVALLVCCILPSREYLAEERKLADEQPKHGARRGVLFAALAQSRAMLRTLAMVALAV